MALFQPTNIIPSTFSGKGKDVVDISDLLSVQWQINGTSGMKAYQIDFYENNATSTPVYSTEIVTPSSAVYGTDSKGNYVPFTHNGLDIWDNYGFIAGKQYKLKILQFFGSVTTSRALFSQSSLPSFAAGTVVYFTLNNLYYVFACPVDSTDLSTIDVFNGNLIAVNYGTSTQFIYTTAYVYSTLTTTAATQLTPDMWTTAVKDDVVVQYSDSVFNAATIPELELSGSPNISTGYLEADYTKFEAFVNLSRYYPKNYVRWRLSAINVDPATLQTTLKTLIDTGDLATCIAELTYYGFVANKQYQIYCEIELENGYRLSAQKTFTALYGTAAATPPTLDTACINDKDGAALLEWTPPTLAANPDDRMIYRLQNGLFKKLLFDKTGLEKIKDFGLSSLEEYQYYVYYSQQGSLTPYQSSPKLCKRFTSFYLYEATEDENDPDVYHVKNVWRFGNNYNGGSISNGNAPQFLANFTKYPLRQGTTVSPKSGTLSALLSNFVDGEYADTTAQMEKLYALSLSENHVFLKDTKGNLYEVHTSAPISQTINTASRQQEVTVSVPWQEVADASNVALIQTPYDEGWVE